MPYMEMKTCMFCVYICWKGIAYTAQLTDRLNNTGQMVDQRQQMLKNNIVKVMKSRTLSSLLSEPFEVSLFLPPSLPLPLPLSFSTHVQAHARKCNTLGHTHTCIHTQRDGGHTHTHTHTHTQGHTHGHTHSDGQTSSPLCVDSKQREIVPELGQQVVQVEVHLTADDHTVRLPSESVHLLKTDLIDLVIALHRE